MFNRTVVFRSIRIVGHGTRLSQFMVLDIPSGTWFENSDGGIDEWRNDEVTVYVLGLDPEQLQIHF